MLVGPAKTVLDGKSRRPYIILYMQISSPRILLRTREKSRRSRGLSYIGRGTAPLQTSPKFFNTYYRLAIPEENVGGCLNCILKMRANKRIRGRIKCTRGGCFVGLFCDKVNNGTAPIIVDLCSLEEEVRHTGIDRGHVGI